jgi:hypothetical protein
MDDWSVWVDALEERNRVECRNSWNSLRHRRKRTPIHLHWNAGLGAILAEVFCECSETLSGIARKVSGFTDTSAVATAIAATSRFIVGSEASMVDANAVAATFRRQMRLLRSPLAESHWVDVSAKRDHLTMVAGPRFEFRRVPRRYTACRTVSRSRDVTSRS